MIQTIFKSYQIVNSTEDQSYVDWSLRSRITERILESWMKQYSA